MVRLSPVHTVFACQRSMAAGLVLLSAHQPSGLTWKLGPPVQNIRNVQKITAALRQDGAAAEMDATKDWLRCASIVLLLAPIESSCHPADQKLHLLCIIQTPPPSLLGVVRLASVVR